METLKKICGSAGRQITGRHGARMSQPQVKLYRVRIASWNINSIRARSGIVLDWLEQNCIDVLALQETKCADDRFPRQLFERAGFEVAHHGLSQDYGVAFISRLPLENVRAGFNGMPGFLTKRAANALNRYTLDERGLPLEARALGVTVGGVRLVSVYVPNGRAITDPHYTYKLDWLHALHGATRDWLQEEPGLPLALLGDWNIAPLPEDVGDPRFKQPGMTHVSELERAAFQAFLNPLLRDVTRPFDPEGFTFWDYGDIQQTREEWLRIDFILGSETFTSAITAAGTDRTQRTLPRQEDKPDRKGPSDHVPVWCELDETLLWGENESDWEGWGSL